MVIFLLILVIGIAGLLFSRSFFTFNQGLLPKSVTPTKLPTVKEFPTLIPTVKKNTIISDNSQKMIDYRANLESKTQAIIPDWKVLIGFQDTSLDMADNQWFALDYPPEWKIIKSTNFPFNSQLIMTSDAEKSYTFVLGGGRGLSEGYGLEKYNNFENDNLIVEEKILYYQSLPVEFMANIESKKARTSRKVKYVYFFEAALPKSNPNDYIKLVKEVVSTFREL